MEVVKTHTCPCRPGFTYSSSQALYQHKRTQRHKLWEERTKCEKIDATKRDNDLFTIRLKLSDREETIEKLNSKIIDLKLKLRRVLDENKKLRKENKTFTTPSIEPPLIEF